MTPRWIWRLLATPALLWLGVFFLVAFYAIVAVGMGNVTTLFEPVPHWNPLHWNVGYISQALTDVAPGGQTWTVFVRTVFYVAAAMALSLLIGYPVAYYAARYAGRRRGLILVLLVLPFWISYIMRMFAWTNLLATDGYAARALHALSIDSLFSSLGLIDGTDWLGGQSITVDAPLDRVPLFVRAGALIPMTDGKDDLARTEDTSRELHYWPAPAGTTSPATDVTEALMFEDDGLQTTNAADRHVLHRLRAAASSDQLTIALTQTGEWPLPYDQIRVVLPASERRPLQSQSSGVPLGR